MIVTSNQRKRTNTTGPRFKYCFSLRSPAGAYFEPIISLMKIKQARSIALFYEDTTFTVCVTKKNHFSYVTLTDYCERLFYGLFLFII